MEKQIELYSLFVFKSFLVLSVTFEASLLSQMSFLHAREPLLRFERLEFTLTPPAHLLVELLTDPSLSVLFLAFDTLTFDDLERFGEHGFGFDEQSALRRRPFGDDEPPLLLKVAARV